MPTAREIELLKEISRLKETVKNQNQIIAQKDNLLVAKQVTIKKQDEELKKQDEKIQNILFENSKLNEIIANLITDSQNKENRIKRDAYNEFFSKSEKTADLLKKAKSVSTKSNKKRGRPAGSVNFKELSDLIPEEVIILNPLDNFDFEDKAAYFKLGTDRTLKIVKVPAKYKLIAYDRPKYVSLKDSNKIYQYRSDFPFGNSIITPSFVANAISLKYELCMSATRISKYILNEMNISISKQNWCNYFEKAANLLTPLYNQLEYELINNEAKAVHFDETVVSLSKSKEERSKNYILVGTSTYATNQIAYYQFIGTRSFKDINIFKCFNGTIICDAYASYFKEAKENKNITIQSCNVHSRRRFADCIKADSKLKVAEEILTKYNLIFDIEAEINKKDNITAQKVIDIRNEKEKPIFEEIKALCEKYKTSKVELLANACEYFINHFDTLTTFLANALLPCHNNKAERVVGEFVRSRRNFQTMVNEHQAQNNSILFTIVQTARINNLNVEKYLEYVLDKLYQNVNPSLLLPWNENIKKQFTLNK